MTSIPSLTLYALIGTARLLADSPEFAPDYRESGCIRWPALRAAAVHDTLTAVGMTGGFISEALS